MTIETITEEFVETEQIKKGKTMYTINRDMLVVETTKDFSNPLSNDYNAIKLFLDNNFSIMKEYHNSDENYGIAFYECGYNGTAQEEFVKGWMENGVKVF